MAALGYGVQGLMQGYDFMDREFDENRQQQMQQQAREQAQAATAKRHALEQEEYYAMRVFLARIVRGEIPKRRVIRYAMRYLIVEETLSPFLTLRAIELDSKLEAWERVTPLFRRQFLRIMQQARKLHHAHLLPTAVPPHAGLPPTVLRECLPPLRPSLKEGGDELSGNTIVQNTDQTVILSTPNAGVARDTTDNIIAHQNHQPHHSSDNQPASLVKNHHPPDKTCISPDAPRPRRK